MSATTLARWMEHAQIIWGERWVAPMARAIERNPRTVQRWKGAALDLPDGAGACPANVQAALRNAALELERVKR